MWRAALAPALATGGFCAVFAAGMELATDVLSLWQIVIGSAVSGFLGSLFARAVLGRRD